MQNADNAYSDHEHGAEQMRRLFETVVAAVDDPLLVFDGEWRLLNLNPAAEVVFSAQAAGTPLPAIIPADLLVLLEAQTQYGEWVHHNRVFVPHLTPVGDGSDSADGWIITLKDITRYKQLSHNQREFVRVVSHDLRSPLTAIQGFAAMLDQQLVGSLNEKQAQFVTKILSSIAQFTALLDNIQDAGRFDVESDFYEMRCAPCDLRDIVDRVVSFHRSAAEARGLHVETDLARDLAIITADGSMLERALRNLVDNAVKYTTDGSTITVRSRRVDGSAVLSVSDTGAGISPDEQARLFQRHVRLARKDHRKIRGSGLGLFIVKNVALRHGGETWVESVEGEGSTFYLSIPLDPDCPPG